jgi:hypothetical protein
LVKSALDRWQPSEILTDRQVASGEWIKVAWSPTLRSLGESLNYFQGHYPGGLTNHASPVTGMLTSGLLGAGLGYGAGVIGEHMLPERWQRGRLRKTLAGLGAGVGMLPGMILGGLNKANGQPFNSTQLLGPPSEPRPTPMAPLPDNPTPAPLYDDGVRTAADQAADRALAGSVYAVADALAPVGEIKEASYIPAIDVANLNRSLWDTGANPQLAGMTMGAVAAAQQLPGGKEPGWVTPVQMAGLAARMGAGWLSGALVGAALGVLTGMPQETQKKLRDTGMYVGVVEALVPRLFGS